MTGLDRLYVANNEWVLVIYWYIYASNGSLNVRYISVLVGVVAISVCQRLWWLYRSVSRQQIGLLLVLQMFQYIKHGYYSV